MESFNTHCGRKHIRPKPTSHLIRIFILSLVLIVSTISITQTALAAQCSLTWDPSSSSGVTGYLVYYSTTSGSFSTFRDAGNQNSYTFTDLEDGETYYFVAAAYDSSGNQSGYSNQVSYTTPVDPPANTAPVASNGSVATTEDKAVSGTLKATDADGNSLTYSLVANGSKGTATITGTSTGAFTYTPNANANGTDTFTFKASDGTASSNTATMTVTITAVNDAPVANNDSASTALGTAVTINVLANDTDVDGDTLSVASVTQGTGGSVTAGATSATYTPRSGFSGTDSFTYTASDSKGGTATATVTVTVKGGSTNTPPVAINLLLLTEKDTAVSGTLKATDADSDSLTYAIVDNGSKGTASMTNQTTGAFTYTPNTGATGTDTFTFKANDGMADSNIATATITISESNGSPTVYEDAEDKATSGWRVYDADPAGATIANVFDSERASHVIELKGSTTSNGYQLRKSDMTPWKNTSQFVIEWSMKYSEYFTVYVDIATTAGHRYIQYQPVNIDRLGTGEYVLQGVGSAAVDGKWHTFVRDLQVDLNEAQPGVTILEVNGFLIRGSGRIDNVRLHNSANFSDTDADGIMDDDEVNIYATDPNMIDTDNDTINDGDEITFWKENWDGDCDGDGEINILDSDSDNDGKSDGIEYREGTDPCDSTPSQSGWTDYKVTLDMGSMDNDAIGVMFRYKDSNNYYRFSWDRQLSYRRLVKRVNGQFTVLAADSVPYSINTPYNVQIAAQGSSLEVWINGSRIFSVADSSLTDGGIALYSWYNAGAGFDNVKVVDSITDTALLMDDFDDGNYDGWTVVDEGTVSGPSAWVTQYGAVMQKSDIYSRPTYRASIPKLGTYLLYLPK